MKKDGTGNEDESTKNTNKETNPIAKKGPAKRGGTVEGIAEEDKEEFEHREEIAKKAAETEDADREWRKINRISDSGVRDDDDDGADANPEDTEDPDTAKENKKTK